MQQPMDIERSSIDKVNQTHLFLLRGLFDGFGCCRGLELRSNGTRNCCHHGNRATSQSSITYLIDGSLEAFELGEDF